MSVNLNNLIDLDLLAYFKSKLDLLFNNKVDKVDGKGLSTNDYTSSEKTKLANIADGAQVNVLEGIQVNGDSITPTNKIANISVPTASSTSPKMDGTAAVGTETSFARGDHVHPSDTKKANLASPTFTGTPKAPTASKGTNTTQIATTAFVQTAIGDKAGKATTLSGYGITDAYTKTEIDQKLVGAMNYKGTVAAKSNLPVSGNSQGDVYHVNADGSEWAWNGETWEELGTPIDLSGYVKTNDVSLATNAQIDKMFE